MRFDVLTIFPEMIDAYTHQSILGRANKKGIIQVHAHDVRAFANDKHHTVDDTPYGGGAGMVMKVEPFDRAIQQVLIPSKKTKVILTAASGKTFTHKDAVRLSACEQLVFLCGRYEGIDARVEEHLVDEVFSIGEFVLTGGELPALVMMDAIARHVPGVLGSSASLKEESHSEEGFLEYPQYTKPEIYRGWSVPEVLLSGNHAHIHAWRKKMAEDRAKKNKNTPE